MYCIASEHLGQRAGISAHQTLVRCHDDHVDHYPKCPPIIDHALSMNLDT
jgi:hypothetical protein